MVLNVPICKPFCFKHVFFLQRGRKLVLSSFNMELLYLENVSRTIFFAFTMSGKKQKHFAVKFFYDTEYVACSSQVFYISHIFKALL